MTAWYQCSVLKCNKEASRCSREVISEKKGPRIGRLRALGWGRGVTLPGTTFSVGGQSPSLLHSALWMHFSSNRGKWQSCRKP